MTTQPVNPQNPHVFDEFLFANQPHLQFNDSVYSLVHRFVNTFVPSLGILSTCTVVYMVLFQTPKHIRAFSKMILLCSLTDVFYALCDIWCETRFQISRAAVLFSFTGPVSLFSYQAQCHSLSIKYVAHSLCYYILPVQYIFRYQALKSNSPPTLAKTIVYTCACLFLSLLNVWTTGRSFCSFDNPQRTDYGQYWYKEVPIPKLIVGARDYSPAVIQTTLFTLNAVLSYALAIFYARRTIVELKAQSGFMSSKTMAMQKQIGRALFAQSLAPLLTAIIPTVFAQLTIQLSMDVGYANDINFSLTTFFPLLNSLSTLCFIAPYRSYCLKILFSCFRLTPKRPQQSGNVAPTPNLSNPSNNSANANQNSNPGNANQNEANNS